MVVAFSRKRCEQCRTLFVPKSRNWRIPRFCSRRCYLENISRCTSHCMFCHKVFLPKDTAHSKFCSRQCAGFSRRVPEDVKRAVKRSYGLRHPEQRKASDKNYRLKYREQIRNKDKVRLQRYYWKYREWIKVCRKEYHLKHRAERCAQQTLDYQIDLLLRRAAQLEVEMKTQSALEKSQ